MKMFKDVPADFFTPKKQASIKRETRSPFIPSTAGVFGVLKRTPIDRQAAMMLATSRWKNAPDIKRSEPKEAQPKKKKIKQKKHRKEPCETVCETVCETGLLTMRNAYELL